MEVAVARKRMFVKANRVRLTIFSGEHWIDIKERLTIGEQKAIDHSGITSVATANKTKGNLQLDLGEFSFARAMAYILDWSLVDDDEPTKRIPFNRAALEALSPEAFEEIENAISAHIESRDAVKKTPAGETASKAS